MITPTGETIGRWESQRYPPEGASAAEGIRNQLGRPALDRLTILIREAAQNSWDARTGRAGVDVDFAVDLRTVVAPHTQIWRDLLLAGAPGNPANFPLHDSLSKQEVRVLTVSDRGTKGLGGPTRADTVTDGVRDFVTFVRNTGEPRDTELGGGTYGFGKGIFYMLSEPHTILIHTRTEHEGRLQTRIIGSCLAHSYTDTTDGSEVRRTGRHWWGEGAAAVVEPLVDEKADKVATLLGLPKFDADETGTSIAIVDPSFDDFTDPNEVGNYLAETIMWHLWPKMLRRGAGETMMRFKVSTDGIEHHVPDPLTTMPIKLFVEAYRQMNDTRSLPVAVLNPKKTLGRLGLNDTLVPSWQLTRAAEMAGFKDTAVHHTCLMRSAELVVTYHPGIQPPAELRGYAGVFRTDESVDDVFARAEPPTHDAWQPDSLAASERTYVRSVFKRLREYENKIAGLDVRVGDGSSVALGAASNYFARLMRGSPGFGGRSTSDGSASAIDSSPDGSPGSNGSGGGVGRRRATTLRVEYTSDPYVARRLNQPVVVQEFVLPPDRDAMLRARLSIAVAVDATGRDRDVSQVPVVLGWVRPDGSVIPKATPIVRTEEGIWQLLVLRTSDIVLVVDVLAAEVSP